MVRCKTRDYDKKDVLKVLKLLNKKEPVKMNEIVFTLGPKTTEKVENAVKTLVEENIIGSRDSFLKTHVNFNPWDTIIYDGIADAYIGVDENKMLYLKNKSRTEYDIPEQKVMLD